MSKAKSPKLLKLPFLNSFQICRPKNPSSMIKTTNLPNNATKYNKLSPLKSKSFDISFPSFLTPPPSTPSKVFEKDNDLALHKHSKPKNKKNTTCNLPLTIPAEDPQTSTNGKENDTNKTRKTDSSDNSEETDSLFSSPPSLNNSSRDLSHPLKTIYEEEIVGGSKKSVRGRRFRRYGSKEWKEGVDICGDDRNKKKLIISSSSSSSEDYYSCHSFVVVKRSVDPYEDFKKSMCEMILEKQMFEPGELEQLLMSFLSLNSRMHHKVIIEAFTEILKEVFCG